MSFMSKALARLTVTSAQGPKQASQTMTVSPWSRKAMEAQIRLLVGAATESRGRARDGGLGGQGHLLVV